MSTKIAQVYLAMGRFHLNVCGIVVATQGDLCRDPDVPALGDDYGRKSFKEHIERCWTKERLEWVKDKINKESTQ